MRTRCIPERVPRPLPEGNCPNCGRLKVPYLPECLCGQKLGPDEAQLPDVQPGLRAAKPPGTYRFAHWSDLHFGARWPFDLDVATLLRALLNAMNQLDVDGLVISGDLTQFGRPKELSEVKRLLDLAGFDASRRVVVPGNHDIPRGSQNSTFNEIFETEYPHVRELAPGLRIIGLDSNALEQRTLFERRWVNVRGRLGRAAMDRAREMCAPLTAGTRFLVLHHHLARLTPEKTWAAIDDRTIKVDQRLMAPLLDADEVLAFANELQITAALHGHKHWYSRTGYRVGTIPVFNAGSLTRMLRPRFRMFDLEDGRWNALYRVEVTL